jgi:hypothetical protein
MSEANRTLTPAASWPPRQPELIDLNTHPDGDLLRLCAALAKTRDAVAHLEAAIVATPSRTADGCRAKGLAL